ncbi:hypothetical protein ACHAW6_009561 [Cyclotella cf. meneghiniana]
MIVDSAKEMRLGEFAWTCKEAMCYLQGTEPYSSWSNSAERKIRELKKGAETDSVRWLHPEMVISGETADIHPFCEFGSWDWVKLQEDGIAFPDDQMVLGNYLGPSIDVGPAMTQSVMKANGKYEDQTTLCQLTPKELGDRHKLARVLYRKRDSNGVPVGTTHKQPSIDTRVYEVHLPDGCTEERAANTIAEASYAQCNPDGNQYVMLDAIMDYRKNPNVSISGNNQVKIVNGKKVVSHSTCSWELCCEWKDSSTSWKKLSDLKESHPLHVTEFAIAASIANEPAINWWVSWVLKKRDHIISLVKHQSARYNNRTHMFGIELPKTMDEAYVVNKATGTSFWCDVIKLEMKNVCVVFDVLPDGVMPPSDHQYMKYHMIFGVNM